MERKTIYKDEKTIVEAAFSRGRILYTVTYFLVENDSRTHLVRVWNDGTIWKE